MPIGSTPGWDWNRRSSTAIIADVMTRGIWSWLSHCPKLGPNETITLAVGGMDADHLAEIVAPGQFLVARERAHREQHRHDQRDDRG